MTDTNPHRATPNQWAQIAKHSTDPMFVVASCVEELRARIEALEANSSVPLTSSGHSAKSELSLVERVTKVIAPYTRDYRLIKFRPEARAAILEIATWMRANPDHYFPPALVFALEQEAEQ